MEGILIREATIEDAAALSRFMADLSAERLNTVSWRPPPTIEEEEAFIKAIQSADHASLLLALDGDQVVGLLDLWAGERPHNCHVAHFGMSVAQSFRDRGIGAGLVDAAIETARGWPQLCRLELEVVPWNAPAIRLYERKGFILEARKRRAINLRGQPEDLLLMALVW